ncbi:MAG: ABC transporter substrate-binding protein [Sphingomonadaceae bacterium]|nr:ABC transporter substrate-binding protein [Sphingomonadaceae bacterium]
MVQGEKDSEGQARVGTFRQQMAELGWIEGRNLQIDYRWGGGAPTHAQAAAAELVALVPDLILANGTPPTAALQKATQTIPVVFVVVTDPVGAGFVKTLSRPGANITGFSTFEPEIGGKWLELLRECSPGLRRVAGVLDPTFTGFAGVWREVEETAKQLGISVTSTVFRTPSDDLEGALASFAREPGGGLIVLPTAINSMARSRLFAIAASQRLPAVYPFRHFAFDGGMMAYGFDPLDLYRRSAVYVDRILKGAKPADLPVQAPIKFELIINLNAAKGLGLTVPPALLTRADEVIE